MIKVDCLLEYFMKGVWEEMKLIKTIEETRKEISHYRQKGSSIALVPTMGALHEGHESLMERSLSENDITVVSIFVNPTQFGPNEDFDSYPRNLDQDLAICKKMGVDIVFAPDVEEMYPKDYDTFIEVGSVATVLEGASRPGHFRGVATVVSKLFNIITPERAYFGQKDAQQVSVIRKMVYDLNIPVSVVPCPIIREQDGLAKSSRNQYLSETERKQSIILSQTLQLGEELLRSGETDSRLILDKMKQILETEQAARLEYIKIRDAKQLKEVAQIDQPIFILIAAYIGSTRLIDNVFFDPEEEMIV